MNYIVANWKSNKRREEAINWLHQVSSLAPQASKDLEIIIAAPFTALSSLKKIPSPFKLAAQNISPFPSGPYTGEVSARMLAGLVDYALVGHSERRRLFGETNEMVAQKVKQALKFQITPIVCLDEPYIKFQISNFKFQISNLIFAYEPLSAIGSGRPDTPKNANRVAEKIKKIANQAPVLYGGSVNSKNARKFMVEKNIDGLLVGNASLDTKEFIAIIKNAKAQA